MILSQGLGNEAREANRREESEGRHCAEDRHDSPLHLGRRYIVRLGPDEAHLIACHNFQVRSAGLAMSRWDGGRGDLGESAGDDLSVLRPAR